MKRLVFLLILILAAASVPAFGRAIPDNAPVRRRMTELMLSPVSFIGVEDGRIIEDLYSGELIKFDVERNGGKLYLIFINERDGGFPLVGSGNVIIRRSLENGSVEQVKIYLDDIGALVLRIRPAGNRSTLSLSLFDDELYSRLPLGIPIEQVMETDVETLMSMSSGRIPWERLFPSGDASAYAPLRMMLDQMRDVLPSLPDADDGAMDENGNLVRIETLKTNELPGFNCSGFAKFLADGVYAALTGGYLSIDELKTKHPDLRGNDISLEYEDERDPYFGLDWTRNIATALAAAHGDRGVGTESSDVRGISWYRYTEDLGYRMEDLIPVLYLQAISDPGTFYLGSVNGEFGSDPVLWQHYHVVALFPYFDEEGSFRIAVLERNVETSVSSLRRRYPDEFIHLVAIRPASDFLLPQISLNTD
jgi:hypothetical protein